LAHSYRTLQQWNHWLSHHFLGPMLLRMEAEAMQPHLQSHYGKHAVLIGVPHQAPLLNATTLPCQTMLSPLISHHLTCELVESGLHELPFLSGSVDLVLLPHTLEYVENPRQLLAEACRIIKPEGLIVIAGFNPYSALGVMQKFEKTRAFPFHFDFITAKQIENWLKLADFEIEKPISLLCRPPLKEARWFARLRYLESLLTLFPFLGGVHLTIARAKVIPLSPIRMKWKQPLTGLRLPTPMSTPLVRQNEACK
jgi:SAM-dependent methyltransferase